MNIINNIFNYFTDTCLFYVGFSLLIFQNLVLNMYILLASLFATLMANIIVQPENIDSYNNIKKKITIITLSIMSCLWRDLLLSQSFQYLEFLFYVMTGFLIADFFSGIFHWMGDAISEHTNFFLFVNFRLHHFNPTNVYSHNFWNLVYDISMVAVIPMIFYKSLWFYTACFFILFANMTHQYSHLPQNRVPQYIKWLQANNIILSPIHHKQHHSPPFKSNFCTLTGWCNIVDKINLWGNLDNVLYSCKQLII